MTLTLARKAFRDARVTLIGGGLLSFAMALLYVSIYPAVKDTLDQMELPDYMEEFAGAAGTYATPAGYLSSEFFTLVPIVLIIFAIVAGTAATAGEESAGTLDLLLAQPVSRRRVILEKSLGIGAAVALALLAGLPGVWIGQAFVDFELSPVRVVASMLVTLPLLWFFTALALFAGALLPNRASAVAFATASAVAAYVVNTMGLLVEFLREPRKLTPFHWADPSEPLVGQYDLAGPLALLALTAALLVAAVVAFERRDIAGGVREVRWSRLLRRSTHELRQTAEHTYEL